MSFNPIQDATSLVKSVASNLPKALNSITNPSELISAVRKVAVPLGGNIITEALVEFIGPENSDDWRVRLSIPFNFFMGSAVFAPLVDAGGFIFPYTPTISIRGQANYSNDAITHQNYNMVSYQNSSPNEITISGDFNVEDATQAQYWIAAVHFLRSVTKMYTGSTSQAGSPPPILSLNGYGDYVFKKIPVVVTNFSVDFGKDCDYISTSPERGLNLSGGIAPGAGIIDNLNADLNATVLATGINALLGGGDSHVPTKSTISVTLLPTYSREAVRQFSLQTFVNGGYVRGGFI